MDPENGWHHVMNRGAARQPIFLSADDGRRFEALLGFNRERHGVEIHAHCLMTNHFHLLLRCPNGGLSDFMHDLAASYARHANDRKGTDGPLFRGRFRSLVVDSDAYLAAVGRYIHRNPKDLPGDVDLVDYRWSSLQYYAGRRPPPPWLTTSVLAAGHTNASAYVDYVTDETGSAGSVRWAVATALAEFDDADLDVSRDRCVATAMLDLAPSALQAEIYEWLRFPTPEARTRARARARRRMADNPQLAAITRRALELCNAAAPVG
jgi:REP element-mobilizing transposase RayT